MKRNVTRWMPVLLAFVVVFGAAAAYQQASGGIGLVNLDAIMEQTPGYQDALNNFQQEFSPVEGELQGMAAARDSMIQDFERQAALLSPTARGEKEMEIRQLQQQLTTRAEELQVRMGERERELLAPLEERVQVVIDGIRAERNLSVVFDLTRTQGIVAADQTVDLTALVIQRLQGSE